MTRLIKVWNERDLSEKEYPFLLVDALDGKALRKGGRVRTQSVLIACGINREGYREVLGLMIGDSEFLRPAGRSFFAWLKRRELKGVDLVVSDDHKGLVNAIMVHFQGASLQRDHAHFVRNVLEACPRSLQRKLHARSTSRI